MYFQTTQKLTYKYIHSIVIQWICEYCYKGGLEVVTNMGSLTCYLVYTCVIVVIYMMFLAHSGIL